MVSLRFGEKEILRWGFNDIIASWDELCLTDQRLICTHGEFRSSNRTYNTVFDVPLNDISGVWVEDAGWFRKKLVVELALSSGLEYPKEIKHFEFDRPSRHNNEKAIEFRDAIRKFMSSPPKTIYIDESEDATQEDEAIKVLKLRYAKGEITKEQYEQMKKDLE